MKSLLIFHFLLFFNIVNAQTIYALLISDTDAFGIGTSVAQNHQMLKQQLEKLEIQTGIKLIRYELQADKVRPSEILKIISALKTTDQDIIWFHYSGHGINNGVNEWPRFLLPGEPSLSLDVVHKMLKKKPHQLLLSFADCCNIGSKLDIKEDDLWGVSAKSYGANEVLRQLLTENKSDIIVSGSKLGHPARYFQSSGGIFTMSLLDALEKCSNNGCYSWEYVLEETRKSTLETSKIFGIEQNLQIKIENNPPPSDFETKIENGFDIYILKNGDTCIGVARKFILSRKWAKEDDPNFRDMSIKFMKVIIDDNKIPEPRKVKPGDKMKVRVEYEFK